ncbi:MAG: hypothetical protein A3F82_07980 [Deltaproteobacteria bacterium RIFCSPLOWO2_12_FULL_44_12]|nr:MAG: hypothetical protein A2712_07290 [Deltaproteobacteria bacterium RIFCSPHIGHO2_01_FULL_43_49]OGQ15748.1 MAG: hypothetical protein A3D22_06080 [Deltaproteobacteria bacterium RIFCSPHIGHO2_02_FULL_44_53]OGQ28717.1 MAG: hypothetical protein A3D98_00815 [Deltaproteobacteria bacterium RIFCSPHIGHO2_12_FULL_44_21]OGQ32041.1 MAG: hypothetical protein A2979_03025 [Deltaproteobacteria bacterium RIFCSPLOWO2_01_FULL_45_74]OGQ43652.1 MAG: hypothetical protein A3I70_03540 [Deltaproteobacteria bacterium 
MDFGVLPSKIDKKYQVLRLLGKGGGGQALLARKGNQCFAIKLLDTRLFKNPAKSIEKFKKEFLTLKKLNHPHVGKLFDFGFDSQLNQYYFVGEYIEGENIHEASLHMTLEAKEKLFVQSLQALHYLHTFGRAGIRHNDIKAANMLVTKNANGEPQLKLIDFGLASFAPLDVKGGTASYMSPEQIVLTFPSLSQEKFPKPDLRADLYSLGVVWTLCFTDQNPFLVEKDSQATLKRHFEYELESPSKLRPELPKYWDKIILKLLKQNPDDRYSSAAEVIQELKFLSNKPYSVIPSTMRHYYLPEGEWIGQQNTWISLKKNWDGLVNNPAFEPELVWIVGGRGQGKTKILEHFKSHVQSHEGRFLFLNKENELIQEESLSDLDRFTQDSKDFLVIAVDDFCKGDPTLPHLERLWQKVRYHKRWGGSSPLHWLFVITIQKTEEQINVEGLNATIFFLKNFGLQEIKELVQKISPKNTDPPEQFIQQLKDHTDGNPLFVTTVLKTLGEKGLLWNDAGAWHPTLYKDIGIDFEKLSIPQDLETTLREDWKFLKPKEKTLLKWLSCFSEGTQIASREADNLLQEGILIRDEKNRVLFKSSFFQRTIYQRLTNTERQRYHAKIASLLKKQKRPAHIIAQHLIQSPNKKLRLKAMEDLAQFYTENGKLAEALKIRQTQPQKPAIAIQTLRLLVRLKKFDEALHLVNKQIAKSDKNNFLLQNMRARILLDEGKIKEATAIYKKTRETEMRNNDLGYTYLLAQDGTQALRSLKEELSFAQKEKDKAGQLRCHYFLGDVCRKCLREFDEAIKQYQMSANLAKDIKDADWLMRIYNGLAATYLDRAQETGGPGLQSSSGGQNVYKQALRYFEESLALCQYLKKEDSELDFETAAIYLNIGTVQRELGNFLKARDAFQTILTVLERKSKKSRLDEGRLCETYIALADCLFAEKKFQEMSEPLNKAWRIAKNSKDLLEHQWGIQLLLAEMFQEMRNFSQFKEHLTLAERLQAQHKINPTPFAKKRLEELKKLAPQ